MAELPNEGAAVEVGHDSYNVILDELRDLFKLGFIAEFVVGCRLSVVLCLAPDLSRHPDIQGSDLVHGPEALAATLPQGVAQRGNLPST